MPAADGRVNPTGREGRRSGRRQPLHGADVCAEDLRGGAGLVLAALAAQGISRIEGIEWIERGYEHFCENLTALGAGIWKK